jgi:RNA polymerase sigma factor (sigma-70 family)
VAVALAAGTGGYDGPEANVERRHTDLPPWASAGPFEHGDVRVPPAVERRLVSAAASGDSVDRGRLVDAFLPSIGGIARRYRGCPAVSRNELMQEGVVGLLRALERYDPDRGTPFWAYASWWVRQAMQGLVAELGRPVVLSDRALRQLARVKEAHREHLQAHGCDPSTHDVAEATGLSRTQIENLTAVDRTPRALDQRIGGEDGGGATFGEFVADPRAEDDYLAIFSRMEVQELRDSVPGRLCERERTVLRDRYGIGCEEHTLQEIATRLGVSAERVRQIEQKALEKLRDGPMPVGAPA